MGIKVQHPRYFFDFATNNQPAGRVVFELFSDMCPKTCKNFRCLCTGEKGTGKWTQMLLYIKSCLFHQVVKDFMVQGGDFSEGKTLILTKQNQIFFFYKFIFFYSYVHWSES